MNSIILICLLKISIVLSLGSNIKIQSSGCTNEKGLAYYHGKYLEESNIIFDYAYTCESLDSNIFFTSKDPNFANAITWEIEKKHQPEVIRIESTTTCSYTLKNSSLVCGNVLYQFDVDKINDVDTNQFQIKKNKLIIADMSRSNNDNLFPVFCENGFYQLTFINGTTDLEKIFLLHATTLVAITQTRGDFGSCNGIYAYKIIFIPFFNVVHVLLYIPPLIILIYFYVVAVKKYKYIVTHGIENMDSAISQKGKTYLVPQILQSDVSADQYLGKISEIKKRLLLFFVIDLITFILITVVYNAVAYPLAINYNFTGIFLFGMFFGIFVLCLYVVGMHIFFDKALKWKQFLDDIK